MDDFNIFNTGMQDPKPEDCCPDCGDPYVISVETDDEGSEIEHKECSCFKGENL